MAAMGGHHLPNEGRTNDWLTPPHVIKALGPFDLDPCASVNQPWRTAETQWTEKGLDREWFGRVWLNPPYGPHVWEWLDRLATHNKGIALIFARTETEGFFRSVWGRADALYFIKGRLRFCLPITGKVPEKGNGGAPSVLVGYGKWALTKLCQIDRTVLDGHLVRG